MVGQPAQAWGSRPQAWQGPADGLGWPAWWPPATRLPRPPFGPTGQKVVAVAGSSHGVGRGFAASIRAASGRWKRICASFWTTAGQWKRRRLGNPRDQVASPPGCGVPLLGPSGLKGVEAGPFRALPWWPSATRLCGIFWALRAQKVSMQAPSGPGLVAYGHQAASVAFGPFRPKRH